MTDFEAVKGLICFRPVNGERNRESLKSMPHRQFLDLAVTYYIPVAVSHDTSGSITVTDKISRMWQVDEETLYRHAVENTRRMLPVELRSMEDVVWEILSEECGTEPPEQAGGAPDIPMYILRCGKGEQATAAALLYGSVLEEFSGQHGDFYILPSSVFEVMLVPAANPSPKDSAYYRGIVREINRAQRLPEEVLSDSAYLYHADTGEIETLP